VLFRVPAEEEGKQTNKPTPKKKKKKKKEQQQKVRKLVHEVLDLQEELKEKCEVRGGDSLWRGEK
jgi:hypothetical protein